MVHFKRLLLITLFLFISCSQVSKKYEIRGLWVVEEIPDSLMLVCDTYAIAFSIYGTYNFYDCSDTTGFSYNYRLINDRIEVYQESWRDTFQIVEISNDSLVLFDFFGKNETLTFLRTE